jgi:hypothetical protein
MAGIPADTARFYPASSFRCAGFSALLNICGFQK